MSLLTLGDSPAKGFLLSYRARTSGFLLPAYRAMVAVMLKNPLVILLIPVTCVGILLNVVQIVTGDFSHPLYSQGKTLTLLGGIGCVLYALSVYRRRRRGK